MIKCTLCGKELKTTQALHGHMQFAHGDTGSQPAARAAAEPPAGSLEERLKALERMTGLRQSGLLDNLSDGQQPLPGQIDELTRQLNEQADRLGQLAGQLEPARAAGATSAENSRKLAELASRVESLGASFENDARKLAEVVDNNGQRLKDAQIMLTEKTGSAERGIDGTRENLGRVEAQQARLQDALKSMERTVDGLKADLADVRKRLLRCPTGNVVTVSLDGGRERRFREYRSPQGLRRPYRTSVDLILGNRWVDLAEPEN